MKRWREFFGNFPIFQKQVERELEAKGIKPTNGVKRLELSRQAIRRLVIGILVIGIIIFAGLSYFNNKNRPPNTPATITNTKKESPSDRNTTASSSSTQRSSDHLLKLSAKERAKEATQDFRAWYKSFPNREVIFEINPELLAKDSGGTSPSELESKLIANLKAKFGNSVSDDFYTSLQTSFNFNPVVVDNEKGLTILKQNDDKSQWLRMWFLDTEKQEANTKIILRNDFPYEWVDWKNDARHREKYKNIFTDIDWDNDLSYEIVGINLTESEKTIDKTDIIFTVMHYNDKLGKWQIVGTIGGIE